MINVHDIQALTDLLRRTPMSPAEAIFASGLVERLAQLAQPVEAEAAPEATPPTPEPAEPPIAPLRPNPLTGY